MQLKGYLIGEATELTTGIEKKRRAFLVIISEAYLASSIWKVIKE